MRPIFYIAVPWTPERFVRLRKLKGVKQTDLARFAGVSQTRMSECEAGQDPSVTVLEKFAEMLECTTDFLLGRGFPQAELSDERFRDAASRMAFDVFDARPNVSEERKVQCRRVIGHYAAPVTSDAWGVLAEQIELAIGPTNGGTALHVVRGGGA